MMLNKWQKRILVFGILIILFSVLFPMWYVERPKSDDIIDSKSFHFVFDPPRYQNSYYYKINYSQMKLQIAVTVFIVFSLLIVTHNLGRDTDKKRSIEKKPKIKIGKNLRIILLLIACLSFWGGGIFIYKGFSSNYWKSKYQILNNQYDESKKTDYQRYLESKSSSHHVENTNYVPFGLVFIVIGVVITLKLEYDYRKVYSYIKTMTN